MKRLATLVSLFCLAPAAHAELQWEPAFPHPDGVYLVDEASHEPMTFYIDHKGENMRIGGLLNSYTFAQDLTWVQVYAYKIFPKGAFAELQMADRMASAQVRCVSKTNKDQLRYLSKLPRNTQMIFKGTVSDYSNGVFTLTDCDVYAEVNLFHAADKSVLLGSWCHQYNGKTYWIDTFYRDDKGRYHKKTEFASGRVSDHAIELRRNRKEFQMNALYEGGGRGYNEFQILYDPFTLSTSYGSLAKPDGTMTRCKKLDNVR